MYARYLAVIALCAVLLTGLVPVAWAQEAQGSNAQRLEVLRSKLDGMKRSLNSAIANINAQESGDKEKDKKTPEAEAITRLRGLEREVSSIMSDVSSLRVKVDKSERFEAKDIEKLEDSVADIGPRVEAGL
ncbi:MAG: hypothetical protein JO360_04700, partial [Acidobacteria bacterium]|nr:hypothetical protein [Acidobacteriota bacterium]